MLILVRSTGSETRLYNSHAACTISAGLITSTLCSCRCCSKRLLFGLFPAMMVDGLLY